MNAPDLDQYQRARVAALHHRRAQPCCRCLREGASVSAGRHRSTPAVTVATVFDEVCRQMRAIEIIDAVRALTLGDAHFERRLTVAGREVRLQHRGPDARMGLFGGGWDRSIGIQLGRSGFAGTIIVNTWKGSIRIEPRKVTS